MQELVKDRMQGRYKDNSEGFIAAFKELSENAGYDYSKKVPRPELDFSPYNPSQDPSRTMLDELWEDRDQLRHELAEQLTSRARKHLFMTKRKKSDFVSPKMSESKVYGRQVAYHDDVAEKLEH